MSTAGNGVVGASGNKRVSASGNAIVFGTGTCACCGSTTCPSDCFACGNRTLTISGASGFCVCLNGTYTLTRSGCTWAYHGPSFTDGSLDHIDASLSCIGTTGPWQFLLHCISLCTIRVGGADLDMTATGTLDACGKGTLVGTSTGAFCSAQTITCVFT